MNVTDLSDHLDHFLGSSPVRATTPHGTYTFALDSVENDRGGVLLHLVEVDRAPKTPKPRDLRGQLAAGIADVARGLLLDPSPPSNAVRLALCDLLAGYGNLLKATSSSNPGYEERDIPLAERNALAEARHCIKVLASREDLR